VSKKLRKEVTLDEEGICHYSFTAFLCDFIIGSRWLQEGRRAEAGSDGGARSGPRARGDTRSGPRACGHPGDKVIVRHSKVNENSRAGIIRCPAVFYPAIAPVPPGKYTLTKATLLLYYHTSPETVRRGEPFSAFHPGCRLPHSSRAIGRGIPHNQKRRSCHEKYR
jgi:hypothetical protein